ncbi:uncharacterized protein LOC111369044 [Olea europaea var. sylvestris]|uniref:uncharacterized protein LOC111369044 n=1 Tax=Olea europaea var. sylvestris TaxID=158386 RepID=UPI000C1CF0F5|nr:uncharacterized protein LOC111369044 [Olea europaea var. sylvestris]
MDFIHWFLIFSEWLIVLSFIQPTLGDDPTQALINKICRQTPDYEFCTNVFNKNLHSPITNAVGLTQIALTRSLENSTNTRIFIQKKEASEKNKEMRDLYEICNAGYRAAMEVLINAALEFASRNYRIMLNFVSESEKPISDCQKIFSGIIQIGLKERNRQMEILISMTLASGRLIVT